MGRLIALIAALAVGALITWFGERLPQPKPISAAATEFSARRAMADVTAIAPAPHPMGSAANAAVRDHILRRMAMLGLEPQARVGAGVAHSPSLPRFVAGGRVVNLVGVLPGRDRTAPAVVIMSHYDSVPGSPGAADDAAGVAAALEIARALEARGTPARDVMLLITDGEEMGLLGANAFFRRDPLARRVGLVLNMEARGSSGRARMFQTSPDNGALVRLLQRHVPRPASSSLTVFVYALMPNDTDVSEALAAGAPALNWAFIGRQFDYHSPSATPAQLDQGALQDMGQQVLEMASAAAFADRLPGREPSLTYATTFSGRILGYPPSLGWAVIVTSAVLVFVAGRGARRIEAFPWTDAARGAGALLFAATGAVALMQFARRATGAGDGLMAQRFLLAQEVRWEWAVGLVGLGFLLLAAAELARGRRLVTGLPLLAGAACSAFGGFDPVGLAAGVAAAVLGMLAFGRPVGRPGAWTGVLMTGVLLAAVAQAMAPTAAHTLAWPLLAAATAAALTRAGALRGYRALALIAVIAGIGLGWIGGIAHGAFQAMDLMPLLALPVVLAGLVLWPLAQPVDGAPPERWVGAILVACGLILAGWIRFADPFDARHPEPTEVVYQIDQSLGRAWRVSPRPQDSTWVREALGAPPAKHSHWAWSRAAEAAPAPYLPQPSPAFSLNRDGEAGRLRAIPPAGVRSLSLRLTPTVAATVDSVGGVPVRIPLQAGQTAHIRWEAPADGVDIGLRAGAPGAVLVRYAARIDGWPRGAPPLHPRPSGTAPFNESDSLLLTGTRRMAW